MKDFFPNEAEFQQWVVDELSAYGSHAQPIAGDPRYPGIPDLSAGVANLDVWAEIKLYRPENDVYDLLGSVVKKGRGLTPQQHLWLRDRDLTGNSLCGVLFAWRTKFGVGYVSFVPISVWDNALTYNLAALALSAYTETINRIESGKMSLPKLIRSVGLLDQRGELPFTQCAQSVVRR